MRKEVERACKRFEAKPINTINFMIHYGYFAISFFIGLFIYIYHNEKIPSSN